MKRGFVFCFEAQKLVEEDWRFNEKVREDI